MLDIVVWIKLRGMSSKLNSSIVSAALGEEWRIAVSRLPQEMRDLLEKPLFSVVPGLRGRWGQWRGGSIRCIELKEELLLEHPWYAVVDVLRHEAAHQIVDTLYPGLDEGVHGAHFRDICLLIGARPQASGDYPTLDQAVFSEEVDSDGSSAEGAVTPQSRLLLKIRKLLSLSESANEHEAHAALLKARELEAHFVEMYGEASASTPDRDEFYTIGIGPLQRRLTVRDSILGSILQEFYHVRVVWNCVPDIESRAPGKYLRQLSISGSRRNIQIASYVHDCLSAYIVRAIHDLPSMLLGKVLTQSRARQDFEIGVLTGVRNALREQNQRPQMRALVKVDEKGLDEFCRWTYPHMRTSKRACSTHSHEARAAGEVAGRRFKLKRGVERGKQGLLGEE